MDSNSMTGTGQKVGSCDWLISVAQPRPGQLLSWDTLVPLCSVKSEACCLPTPSAGERSSAISRCSVSKLCLWADRVQLSHHSLCLNDQVISTK